MILVERVNYGPITFVSLICLEKGAQSLLAFVSDIADNLPGQNILFRL